MIKPYQEVRPSQFLITFGPGSIVETESGPVVLKSMDTLFNRIGRSPQDFEIIDDRLRKLELGDARIARVPANAELQLPVDQAIYPTTAFPYWALCAQHRPHQVLYEVGAGCPECPKRPDWKRKERGGKEAIRFIIACENGHMDEVHWHRLVHSGANCGTRHYRWHGGGRALKHVWLECPKCLMRANFGIAYGRPWPCTARLLENGARPDPSTVKCVKDAHIVQRGSANLRLPEIVTALTIMEIPTRLHDVLTDRSLLGAVRALHRKGLLDDDELLENAREAGIPGDSLAYLKNTPWPAIRRALDQLLEATGPDSVSLRDDEFERLRNAAANGAPAIPHPQLGSPPLFEVHRSEVRTITGPSSRHLLRISPVSRLRMVMVQTGYRRLNPQTGQLISTSFDWVGQPWYPGVELFGEGIFIDLADASLSPSGDRLAVWRDRHRSLQDPLNHPVHVWWHSLAHRLLWALSVDSGYSSAAIRERVYLRKDGDTDGIGGLLLYTVQPGGDGTLGGLVSLVNRFEQVLTQALQDVDTCSNDPLCEEAPTLGADGAACYSCLFASETSCEHRNLGLDRLLLSQNLP